MRFALNGSFSFQDYAVAKWPDHISAIVKMATDEFAEDEDSQAALQDIQLALDEFTDYYENDILHDSINDMVRKDCEPFMGHEFHNDLLYVWNHIYCHHEKGSQVRNDISIDALSRSFTRNRKLLENIYLGKTPSPSGAVDILSEYYGNNLFKCHKITCFYFHEGYTTPSSLVKHINRHDRPFVCVFPDCSIAQFGFANNKDLEKHRRDFHPDATDYDKTFSRPTKAVTPSTRWRCEICNKLFTRNFQLKNHTRIHTGDRPFACSECGKAFARLNDCTRHEKIHTRRS